MMGIALLFLLLILIDQHLYYRWPFVVIVAKLNLHTGMVNWY